MSRRRIVCRKDGVPLLNWGLVKQAVPGSLQTLYKAPEEELSKNSSQTVVFCRVCRGFGTRRSRCKASSRRQLNKLSERTEDLNIESADSQLQQMS